ncbi:MAG TPA: hypothetical protein VGA81_06380 [Methylomirabilota bacterium]
MQGGRLRDCLRSAQQELLDPRQGGIRSRPHGCLVEAAEGVRYDHDG